MEITTILYTTFISLVGLQMCVPDGEVEKLASISPIENLWCPNPYLRLLYGIIQLVGTIFVLFGVGIMTFTVHWWYLFVYLVLLFLSKIASFIVLIPFAFIDGIRFFNSFMYGELQLRRLIGSIIIIISIILFLYLS